MVSSSLQNRLKWAAWILTYLCAYVPPLVDMKMTNKDWQWYSWLGWGPLVSFVFVFVIMFFRGNRLCGTIVNCLLIGSLVNIGLLAYSSYRTFEAVSSLATEADRLRSKSNFVTTVLSGALAGVSMIIQWMNDRLDGSYSYSTQTYTYTV
ncbi:hypothetical protein BGZ95_008469 [Linnemannia exigua]|uniref:Uncharacterized protein n=1 Tax=Linnemannia exigua TaxID=604196 RepID=A0AAD4DE84_9FUNG|nr:hypothetical protein BGZ95_008469 [Linnemannia exigua]